MEQVKAVNALEPFLALSKFATSARAAADLVTRATSAPNTYVFAELLQTPAIQGLATSSEYANHLTLLQIFSYGTYGAYTATPNLPALNDSQLLKLRQLSLLTLAADGSSALGYAALMQALGLETPRQLEDLVISCVYAGLIRATLDPKNQRVRLDHVAALRDASPDSIPVLLSSLRAWAARCESTLAQLEGQIQQVIEGASRRATEKADWNERVTKLVDEERKSSGHGSTGGSGTGAGFGSSNTSSRGHGPDHGVRMLSLGERSSGASGSKLRAQRFGKRGIGHMDGAGAGGFDDEAMDVDENEESPDGKKRSSRRKLQG
ncbi:hypothetical protein VTK73DRAFT_2188 [Phialemonium thermophilum]|uniref:PCI domain-containing protein n=1 Tax=Phialemonium thermophilum TaxID=223376 RepID=A0ABR3Y2H2_9PEZI